MADFIFRYGTGKSADLCQNAYCYQEAGQRTLTINADENRRIVSHVNKNGKTLLERDIDLAVSPDRDIYTDIYHRDYATVRRIFVDNAHFLTEEQVMSLFLVAKVLDIDVTCYGNRRTGKEATPGAMRIMELANSLESLDSNNFSTLAHLHFYYGAMNCSKTSKMLLRHTRLLEEGMKVCIVRPSEDRDAVMVKSRIGLEKPADIILSKEARMYGEGQYLYKDHINYILVDEAQFLTAAQINDLYKITRDYQIPVLCYGLKMDFSTRHFTGSGRLLELADQIEKMETTCGLCGGKAEYNARKIIGGDWESEGEQVVIDNQASRLYTSLCDTCYLEHVWKLDPKKPKMLLK